VPDTAYVTTLFKLLKTTTFKLAAIYLLVFAVSAAAILFYVYWSTAGLLARQTDATIEAEITGLEEQYRQGGLSRLINTIRKRARKDSANVYLLSDFRGRSLAGNLATLPPGTGKSNGWINFPYAIEGAAKGMRTHDARARYFTLRGQFHLVVGRDIEEQQVFVSVIRAALFWSLGLVLLLGLAGGLLMSRNILTRINAINSTSKSIMSGDLTGRMPISGSGDELDQLAENLNSMLAQIERLMTGMREVTDNVAHDLRTPLTRLKARAEDALRNKGEEGYKTALENTIKDADDLIATFAALLSIARARAGEMAGALETVDLSQIAKDVAELYEPVIEAEGGNLKVEIDANVNVKANRQLLAQVAANLLDNAVKYGLTTPTKSITISTGLKDNKAIFTVSDHGTGIGEKDHARAIERFTRLETSRSKPGSGLGLSLVKAVTDLHGGELEFADNHPGLKISLIFPLDGKEG
jgi:signal transduction histidine kinase